MSISLNPQVYEVCHDGQTSESNMAANLILSPSTVCFLFYVDNYFAKVVMQNTASCLHYYPQRFTNIL